MIKVSSHPRNKALIAILFETGMRASELLGMKLNEVEFHEDYCEFVCDGKTGKRKNSTFLPPMDATLKERPYELNSGDSIAFLNLSGGKTATEIMVKDRYKYFWIYDRNLKLLWKGDGQTGHFPYPYDIDGDGKEHPLVGRRPPPLVP